MHAVVNHIPFQPGVDWADISRRFGAFVESAKATNPKFNTAVLCRVSDTEGIFVGIFDDLESLTDISDNIAGPWFGQNLRPLLSGPTSRTVSEVMAGYVGSTLQSPHG
jgi:hypothetical protein